MICPKCGYRGSPKEFRKTWDKRKSPECKKCYASYFIEYRRSHVAKTLIIQATQRAKKEGLDFNLIENELTIPEFCPVLGIPLKTNTGGKRMNDNSPTLDRVDSSKGYVRDNCVVISWKANRLKSNGTIDDHKRIAEYIRSHQWVRA